MDQLKDWLTSRGVVVVPWPRQGWRGLTSRQRLGMLLRGCMQTGLLVAAVRDLRRRPADQVRGAKWLWTPIVAVNYLGLGPIAYLLAGRRRR